MENKSHAFVAGLFVLLLGGAVLLALYWLGGGRQATREYVVVTKQNIGGLNPQAQVRYRGIRVGKVSDIRLDPEDISNILISIEVKDDVPLTKGTIARLNYQGVTGLAHILLLETGKDKEPLLPVDGEPPQIHMMPSLFDELGESGAATLRQARQVMANLNALLDEHNRQQIASVLGNLQGASGALPQTLENLNATLGQVRKLLADNNLQKVSQATGELGPLLAESRALVGRMEGSVARLDGAIGDASGVGVAALMPRLSELSNDFSATARQLNRMLRVLEDTPHSLVFGTPQPQPGPGEPGFKVREE